MEITWIIEKYDNSEYFDSLEKSIAKYGQNCIITNILPDIDKNQCVICYGSLQFAYKCRKLAPWVPSLFYTKDNYNCNVYYSYLSKYLLNRDYLMLPVMEVFNRWEELNLPDRIFMRPNDGNKVFTGDVFTFDNRKEDISYLQQYALRDLDNIIGLVSSVKKIEREWRVIVNSDGIISYSLYLSNGEVKEQCSIDSGAVDVAMGVVNTWIPDKIAVLDICLSEGGYYLLEINCFNTSGIYACDTDKIVVNVAYEAEKEWLSYQNV